MVSPSLFLSVFPTPYTISGFHNSPEHLILLQHKNPSEINIRNTEQVKHSKAGVAPNVGARLSLRQGLITVVNSVVQYHS